MNSRYRSYRSDSSRTGPSSPRGENITPYQPAHNDEHGDRLPPIRGLGQSVTSLYPDQLGIHTPGNNGLSLLNSPSSYPGPGLPYDTVNQRTAFYSPGLQENIHRSSYNLGESSRRPAGVNNSYDRPEYPYRSSDPYRRQPPGEGAGQDRSLAYTIYSAPSYSNPNYPAVAGRSLYNPQTSSSGIYGSPYPVNQPGSSQGIQTTPNEPGSWSAGYQVRTRRRPRSISERRELRMRGICTRCGIGPADGGAYCKMCKENHIRAHQQRARDARDRGE
ncbi:uncharacterized protein BKA55DRAFT_538476 [Fusarium redolens]|uniref:Uncharacterized protein n=1 Tax=Fusarium redolens TaxID=48865 RepID=A0A9P9HAJ2_FUSRE|nr:uncharacterized protein BKA55DRAFT_538476 [Fusarium redolens]KAH7253610.1 hypothetical protein BKA55DRAFT_538476 [Fusarium redolens]